MIGCWLRRARRRDDSGFALLFALFVTTMVMAAVTTTLVITTPNIATSKNNEDTSGALLAAQSGINDAVAYLVSIPACRSETRICPQALGADSAKLSRPSLGTAQTFHWTTNSSATTDGYVRVTSAGTEGGVTRTLVADLALNASILNYGYYSDYESLTPNFINAYYPSRNIYVTNTSWLNSGYGVSSKSNATITWNGAANPPTGYSDSVCAQHWYSDGTSSPGRGNATHQSTWEETGALNGHALTDAGSCDLVFTAGMTENGPTYSRDALDIANGNGNGPVFNKPVSTLWGYTGKNSPAAPAQPWRQSDGAGNDTLSSSPYQPTIATQDITLPTTIGTDGVENNSCVYYGPTRVVLNGDGTANVTSPETTSAATGADSGCYPSNVSQGIYNFTYNYNTFGSGTIYVKNLSTPTTGTWPTTTLKSTSTPSANNEVFWIPDTTSTVTADPSTAVSQSSACSSSNPYSATANATCSWTNVPAGTYASSSQGWTAYSSGSACNKVTATTDEQYFQCEYNHLASSSTSTPSVDGYTTARTSLQTQLAGGSCVSGASSVQQSCIESAMDTALTTANTSQHAYNYASPATGDHRYFATTASTPIGTTGSATSNLSPTPGDSLFSFTGTPGQEKSTSTPLNFTVYRQTYNKGWSTGTPQFSFTVVHTDWAVTSQPNGHDYFPNVQDVTPYAMGSTTAGVAAGTTGADQPGDLYVQGVNQGILSLIAQNNVEITGNITKGSGNDSSAANPVSITAGNDIRNYHPVSCTDQTTTDITNTTAGWCPNDLTGTSETASTINSDGSLTSAHPASQYTNMLPNVDRTIDAALFTLTGSLRTDNYNRGTYVGNLVVNGGVYQSHRGANGVTWGNANGTPGHSGTSLNYNYVDLERANLQYVPSASYSNNPRVWNVVSVSASN